MAKHSYESSRISFPIYVPDLVRVLREFGDLRMKAAARNARLILDYPAHKQEYGTYGLHSPEWLS